MLSTEAGCLGPPTTDKVCLGGTMGRVDRSKSQGKATKAVAYHDSTRIVMKQQETMLLELTDPMIRGKELVPEEEPELRAVLSATMP